jgi:hypothetical protein
MRWRGSGCENGAEAAIDAAPDEGGDPASRTWRRDVAGDRTELRCQSQHNFEIIHVTTLPRDISTDPIFDFHTNGLGRLVVDDFTVGHMMKLERSISKKKETSPTDLIDNFILELAKREDGSQLSEEQVSEIGESEKEDFAEQFLAAEDHLYREQIPDYVKDDKGQTTARYRKGEVILPREPNEPAIQYFSRAYNAYRERQNERFRKLARASVGSGNWATTLAVNALAKNFQVSDGLSKNLAAIRGFDKAGVGPLADAFKGVGGGNQDPLPLHSITLPPNPVWETNEHLNELVERFDRVEAIAIQAVELVQTMNTAASSLVASFREGAESTERFARRSIWMAFIALATSFVMPLFQVWHEDSKSQRQDAATKEIVRQLTDVQQRASANVRDAIAAQDDRAHIDQVDLVKAISALRDVLQVAIDRQKQGGGQPDISKPVIDGK